MRCPNCSLENAASAQYCTQCGAELKPSGTPSAKSVLQPAPLAPAVQDVNSLQPRQTMHRGQYRVVRQLGKGGMGAIYLAENTDAFDRLCVIKEMLAYYDVGDEQKAKERFESEARTLAALKHPGIPDMYGFFSEAGRNFSVREYIEGRNLEQLMEDRSRTHTDQPTLPVDDGVRYTVQVCRVLEYLAAIQPEPVVHCDIKPANIIVDKNSGQAVLVDFGTAKTRYLAQGGQAHSPSKKRPSVYGTVGYAAPEMFKGRAVPRSDVFALAATLYFCLTGDDPQAHPFKWPQLDRIPGSVRSILEQALSNESQSRLDAAGLRRQLEAYRASQNGTIQPLTFPRGDLATSVTGLLDLSLRHWNYARQILYDGSLDAWLRNTLHDPVAANRARDALQTYPDAQDAGLDAFVRGLNPRIQETRLALSESQVDLGQIAPNQSQTAQVTLENVGTSGARGTIDTSEPWLDVSPKQFGLGPKQKLAITIRTVANPSAKAGQRKTAKITIASSSAPAIQASLRMRIGPPVTHGPKAAPVVPSVPAQRTRTNTSSPSHPAHQQKRKTGALLLAALALIVVGIAATYVYQNLWPLGRPPHEQAIEALARNDWDRASRILAKIDPQDSEAVIASALALNEQVVALSGGVLRMGSDESLASDQHPAHSVLIDDMEIDRFEVTNLQYMAFCLETDNPVPTPWTTGVYPRGEALLPVRDITWYDALVFAAWAGKRLPTEAEWEWAARGAEGRPFPWGDDEQAQSRANLRDVRLGAPVAVGTYPSGATPEGVYDLAGNVQEWTADYYGSYADPHTPPSAGNFVAVRGSSWRTFNDVSSARGKMSPAEHADDLGFRCVR